MKIIFTFSCSGMFRNIPEHEKIKVIFMKKIIIIK